MTKEIMKDRIKKIRIETGLNQSEFAKKLNISQSAIGYYESGKKKPSAETLEAICNEFDIDGTWLLTGRENKYKTNKLELTETEYILIRAMREWKEDKEKK
jgi:transcriptional regulator with XRE-family HTH domain